MARLYTSLTPAQRARYARVRPNAIELYRGGATAKRVSAKFNVGVGTVLKWAREEGILRGRGGHPLSPKRIVRAKKRVIRIGPKHELVIEPASKPNGSLKSMILKEIGENADSLRGRLRSVVDEVIDDLFREVVEQAVREKLEALQ